MEDNDIAFGSDEEPETVQNVLKAMEEIWLNEKFSPELLPHRIEIVDCVLDQVQQMEENVSRLKKNDFRVVIHRMELDRLQYVVASYLRTRVDKIELFAKKILQDDSKRDPDKKYLSPAEYKFATEYSSHMESHFQLLAMNHMPTHVQTMEKSKMMVLPNTSSYVFLRAKRNISGIIVEGDSETQEEEVDLDENSQHIMQYKSIANYLDTGDVRLI